MKKFLLLAAFLVTYSNIFAFLTQANWRWRNDDGSETTATWKAAQNTPIHGITQTNGIIRLRLEVYNNTGANVNVLDTLQYATSTVGPWTNIDTVVGFNPFVIAGTSAFVVQAEPTTAQLSGVAFPFAPGKIMVDSQVLKNFNLGDQKRTEFEWAIRLAPNAPPNTTFYFRQWGTTANNLDIGMTYPTLITGSPSSFVNKVNWRWRNDDGSETAATWKAGQNNPITLTATGGICRLRFQILNNTGADVDVLDTLQYSTDSFNGPWTNIDTVAGSNPFMIAGTSAFVVQGETTTGQLTLPDFSAAFAPGRIIVDSMVLKNVNLADQHYTEIEWAIRSTSAITPNTTYFFREVGTTNDRDVLGYTYLKTAGVLPIKLTGFTADKEDKKVKLEWITATEQNNGRFEIQRSSNGIHFTQIGQVKAAGNSSIARSYHFDDANPATGINYYRLRIVDVDNSAIYSEVKSIRNISSLNFTIYPNPVKNLLKINIEAEKKGDVQISINNVMGQTLYSRKIKIEQGSNSISIDVNNFPKGTYIVKAQSSRENYMKKFSKE